MTIVHFTRFRVAADRPAILAARQASLLACAGSEPQLRGAYLVRLADREWLDIALWAGQPGTDPADSATPASRSAFYAQIEELLGEECGILVEDAEPQPSHPAGADHGGRDLNPAGP